MNFMSGMPGASSLDARVQASPYVGKMKIGVSGNLLYIRDKDDGIQAKVFVDTLDANCGVCHIHDWNVAYVSAEYRKELLTYIEKIAKDSLYGRLITGITSNQQHVKTLLESCGFELYDQFKSPRTGSKCLFYRKDLTEKPV